MKLLELWSLFWYLFLCKPFVIASTLKVPPVNPLTKLKNFNDQDSTLKDLKNFALKNVLGGGNFPYPKGKDQVFPVTGLPGGRFTLREKPLKSGLRISRDYSRVGISKSFSYDGKSSMALDSLQKQELPSKAQEKSITWWRRLIKRFLAFFWGNYRKLDKENRFSSLLTEKDWREVLESFSEADIPDSSSSEWFKELENGFSKLSKADEWQEDDPECWRTAKVLKNLIGSLVMESPTKKQTEAILNGINYITGHNKWAKEALFEAVARYPIVFDSWALAVERVRPDSLPSTKAKNSFEAMWLTSNILLERFYRTIFTCKNIDKKDADIRNLVERLKNTRNVFEWTKDGEGEPCEIKKVMTDAMIVFHGWRRDDTLIDNYRILEYIARVNKDAMISMTREFSSNSIIRTTLLRALIILYEDPLFDSVPENSLAASLLMDPTLGPILGRTYLEETIHVNTVSNKITGLKSEIIQCGDQIQNLTIDPKDPKNVPLILNKIIEDLSKWGTDEGHLLKAEVAALGKMLGYLQRWNPFVRDLLWKAMEEDHSLFKSLSKILSMRYSDGALQSAPKHTFEYGLVSGSTWAELFARDFAIRGKPPGSGFDRNLEEAVKLMEDLPRGWYKYPAHSMDVSPITNKLIDYLDGCTLHQTDPDGEKIIKLLQHLTYYRPEQKDLVLIELQKPTCEDLYKRLTRYYKNHFNDPKKSSITKAFSHVFASWLRENMKDLPPKVKEECEESLLKEEGGPRFFVER